MKTLKIVAALFLILGLTTITVSGQKKPVTIVAPLEIIDQLYFDCLDQYLVGTLTATRTFMNNHMVAKVSGTLIGSVDGLEYSVEFINSKDIDWLVNWDDWGQKAIAYTWTQNLHVLRQGKLIGIMGFAYHYIVNANGEVTSTHGDVYRVTCVGGK
jgi:hypothetical protein